MWIKESDKRHKTTASNARTKGRRGLLTIADRNWSAAPAFRMPPSYLGVYIGAILFVILFYFTDF